MVLTMATHRGTSNRDSRGSTVDRHRRKVWLLTQFGDGVSVLCSFECGTVLDYNTITVDRYPLPGCRGGRYVRGNIRPACGPCNSVYGAPLRSY